MDDIDNSIQRQSSFPEKFLQEICIPGNADLQRDYSQCSGVSTAIIIVIYYWNSFETWQVKCVLYVLNFLERNVIVFSKKYLPTVAPFLFVASEKVAGELGIKHWRNEALLGLGYMICAFWKYILKFHILSSSCTFSVLCENQDWGFRE